MTKLPDWEETFNALSEEDKAAMGEQRAIWENLIEQRHAALVEIEELAAARKFNEALVYIESHERADKIVTWDEQYKFTDDEAREIIRENWSVTEAWGGDERLRNGLMGLLRRVAPIFVYADDEAEHITALSPDPITIFRGNLGERPGSGSWTLSATQAEWFAAHMVGARAQIVFGIEPRDEHVCSVWRATVMPDKILGYFNDRGEREIVVDGKDLRDVTLIRQAVKS